MPQSSLHQLLSCKAVIYQKACADRTAGHKGNKQAQIFHTNQGVFCVSSPRWLERSLPIRLPSSVNHFMLSQKIREKSTYHITIISDYSRIVYVGARVHVSLNISCQDRRMGKTVESPIYQVGNNTGQQTSIKDKQSLEHLNNALNLTLH